MTFSNCAIPCIAFIKNLPESEKKNEFKRIKQHPSASELIFLKCTGDGFLAVFSSMPAALATAESLLADHVLPFESVLLAVLIEQQRRIEQLEARLHDR